MPKTATVRARIEPELKAEAEEVLGELGLNPTTAIAMYYEQIVKHHAIPFEVSLPNATTRQAMRDAEDGREVARAKDVGDFFAKLNADD